MTQLVVSSADESPGGRTIVVGVKLDLHSRELLTWALMKVAQSGDRVIALHVLNSNEIVNREGKSSLFSLVKSFDSILAVYEGFCNLKQVDLKLKICRGTSVRKILVREAKSYFTDEVIVGTAQTHHTIRSSVSVAKYCAKKLSKDCSVLAVNNGKIIFRRESTSRNHVNANETELRHRNGLLNALQRSFSRNIQELHDGGVSATPARSLEWKCSVCSDSAGNSCCQSKEPSNDDSKENSMAIVQVEKSNTTPSSIALHLTPGWPLLRQSLSSNRKPPNDLQSTLMVQWAMRLPSRYALSFGLDRDQSSEVEGDSRAICTVVDEKASLPSSPEAKSLPEALEDFHEKYFSTCRLFTYNELVSATSNFSPGNLIGKGGSSRVYKGFLSDEKELAIKILNPSGYALEEFVLEIEIITTLHHNNIISLFGFCFEDDCFILVYDFLSRGSLEDNLHGNNKGHTSIGWSDRYKVAIGVAEALDYLHTRETQPVIHRDVKSSNILLSEDFEPQLSDFGLAKWAPANSSYITCTDVAGTFGYLAPEYFMFGKVNEKSDVYAYGVVLLELLSGRKPINNNCPKGEESLVMWARTYLNSDEKFSQFLDPNLGCNYDLEEIERMVLAASLCTRRAPRARPKMSRIVKLLRGDIEAVKWARLQVNASEVPNIEPESNALESPDALDDEKISQSNIRSHLNLALLGVDEDSLSLSSIEQNVTLEDYLKGRWSRSPSFD